MTDRELIEQLCDNPSPIVCEQAAERLRDLSTLEPRLGLASTEELFRELICRLTVVPEASVTTVTAVKRGLILAEMLGSLSTGEREYRTVG